MMKRARRMYGFSARKQSVLTRRPWNAVQMLILPITEKCETHTCCGWRLKVAVLRSWFGRMGFRFLHGNSCVLCVQHIGAHDARPERCHGWERSPWTFPVDMISKEFSNVEHSSCPNADLISLYRGEAHHESQGAHEDCLVTWCGATDTKERVLTSRTVWCARREKSLPSRKDKSLTSNVLLRQHAFRLEPSMKLARKTDESVSDAMPCNLILWRVQSQYINKVVDIPECRKW